jgi:hypothetical protein
MAKKPCGGVPISPEAPPDDPEQSKRFIDMAREVEADEDPEAFERAFKAVTKSRQTSKHPRKPSV